MIPDLAAVPTEDIGTERLDTADRLGHQMVRFVRLVTRLGSHLASQQAEGMEPAAYVLLARLVIDGSQRATALAEAVHSDTSTVSRQTAALVRNGLVERTADPADGRASLLAATERGERMFEHNRRQRDAHLATMLSDWSAGEVRQLTGLLDRFNTDFEAYRSHLVGTGQPVAHHEGETVR
ncbi:MAG: MarR family winged helix-turn-helix transcriptional regulator [Sciscionella sp.]